jgi:hypothetical protein
MVTVREETSPRNGDYAARHIRSQADNDLEAMELAITPEYIADSEPTTIWMLQDLQLRRKL